MATNLYVTYTPVDEFGNAQTGLTLKLRKTDSDGAYITGGEIDLTETPALSGVYISDAIPDVSTFIDPDTDTTSLGNYELWKYDGASPDEELISDYMIGASNGVLTLLKSLSDDLADKSDVGHTHAVEDLSDVVITSVATGEVLKYNGTDWINNTLTEAGIAASSHTHDDRYYTESEADALLADKSDSDHDHAEFLEEDEIQDLIDELPGRPPQLTISSTVDFIDSADISNIGNLVAVPIKHGELTRDIFVNLTLGYKCLAMDGGNGYVIDNGHEIVTNETDFNLQAPYWIGCNIYFNGTVYKITAAEWSSAAKFTLDGAGDLSALQNQTAYFFSGEFYEIVATPYISGSYNYEKSKRFLLPILVNGEYRTAFKIKLDFARQYFIEARAVRSGNVSLSRTSTHTPAYTQGTSTSSNVSITATEFGATVTISKSGDWANADAFEVCWVMGATASFNNDAHYKAIIYATKFDVVAESLLTINVAVRPLRNGVVIAPAYNVSTVSGSSASGGEGGEVNTETIFADQYNLSTDKWTEIDVETAESDVEETFWKIAFKNRADFSSCVVNFTINPIITVTDPDFDVLYIRIKSLSGVSLAYVERDMLEFYTSGSWNADSVTIDLTTISGYLNEILTLEIGAKFYDPLQDSATLIVYHASLE